MAMDKVLRGQISSICEKLFDNKTEVNLSRPDEKFGDYSTNVALQLAKKVGKPPREIAEAIANELNKKDVSAEVAGPGFINIRLPDAAILKAAQNATELEKPLKDQVVVAEYSDPNPFKVLHAGHLYTTLVGDVVANIQEAAGGDVKRVNYGGDVGLHAAKSLYAIIKELGGEYPDKLDNITDDKKLDWLSERYVAGSKAYDENNETKNKIIALNKKIYQIHQKNDKKSDFAKIYWLARKWSYDGFETFYKKIQVKQFDKYYPESSVSEIGKKMVQENIGPVYEKSDGAIVFKGEPYGMHTRVFINKEDLPTYEAKEVGVSIKKYQDYRYDKSIIITANEIMQYMQVVIKSISMFEPKLAERTIHLNHGMVKMVGGNKMSSRKGNILRAQDVLDAAHEANNKSDYDVTLGAVKYAMLKNSIGGDVIYSPKDSVSLEGNSGPYLQYALVRARSILGKTTSEGSDREIDELDVFERSLARKLSMYPEAFEEALNDYSPHHICTYLYELAQIFNRFYENSRVAGDPRENLRMQLVNNYQKVLSHGLKILGIPTPEKM